MMLRNRVSRFEVAEAAVKGAAKRNEVRISLHELTSRLRHEREKTSQYVWQKGKDPDGAYDTPNFEGGGSVHRDVEYAD